MPARGQSEMHAMSAALDHNMSPVFSLFLYVYAIARV